MANGSKLEMDRWLDTTSGRRVNLLEPTPDSIAIEDIVGALSRICRFGGHTREFYSVAQHSVLVCRMMGRLGRPDLQLLALHHDSHEAYLGDMPTPLKKRLRDMDQYFGYEKLVLALDWAIGEALGISRTLSKQDESALKRADRAAFQMEARLLLPRDGVDVIRDDDYAIIRRLPKCPRPLSPKRAAKQFLDMHNSLTRRQG